MIKENRNEIFREGKFFKYNSVFKILGNNEKFRSKLIEKSSDFSYFLLLASLEFLFLIVDSLFVFKDLRK